MKSATHIHLHHVQSVYSGPEGKLWELLMGQQIHIGGLQSSTALADRAGIRPGQQGVDLCCATGAGHCAREGEIIRQRVRQELGLPVLEWEVPSLVDPLLPTLGSRLQALLETARLRRRR